MIQHQKAFVVDEKTGIVTLEFQFPQGPITEEAERAVNPVGPRPGHEVRTRWFTKPDGCRVLQIGEVSTTEVPKGADDLEGKSIGTLVTLGVREGLNGRNGTVALNTEMNVEDVKLHIRAHRKAKAKKAELVGACA